MNEKFTVFGTWESENENEKKNTEKSEIHFILKLFPSQSTEWT